MAKQYTRSLETEEGTYINLRDEIEDYFNHRPDEKFIGIALLTTEQIYQVYDDIDITEAIDLIGVIRNQGV